MKRKFYRSCVAVLLSMVMIFGGVHIGAAADGGIVPFGLVDPILPTINVNVTAPSTHMTVGGTMQLTCTTSPSGLSVTWTSSNSSIATVSSGGLVTAHQTGTVTITGSCYDSTTQKDVRDSVSITVHDSTGIQSNTVYYIMNAGNDRLLGRQTADYLSSTNVATVGFSAKDRAKWTVVKESDGSFSLKNMNGNTGSLYLNVNGTDVTLSYGFKKFSIDRITTGDYKGLYLIRYDNKYLAQNTNYDAYLTSTLSVNCYWSFMEVGTRFADIFGFDHYSNDNTRTSNSEMINSTKHFDYFKEVMSDIGYIPDKHINALTSFTHDFLRSDDIFVYVGHADFGMIVFRPDPTAVTPEGRIIAHSNIPCLDPNTFYIDEMPDNALARERCVLYLGCNSGSDFLFEGINYNLVDETFNKGAHFVFGFTQVVINGDVDDFLEGFLAAVHTSLYNIEECIDIAQRTVILDETNNDQYLSYYSRGDQSQYLSLS